MNEDPLAAPRGCLNGLLITFTVVAFATVGYLFAWIGVGL